MGQDNHNELHSQESSKHDLTTRSPWQQHPYLSIAGEGGVVKQEVSTKEEDNSVKQAQEGPVDEDRPT